MEQVTSKLPSPQRVKAIVLNGDGHAFDTRSGRSYRVNPTATVALLMLQDGARRDDIVRRLCALCDQTESIVGSSIDVFLDEMARVAS
jgi:hypothetical protein